MVKICTQYAQAGMFNIFIVIFCLTLAYAFFDPIFFVAYLISIAVVGLFQAIYMANAGGAWDNAKKVVEVDLKEKGTALHDATVVGDTVGDPYKDTSSVALNPIIKFTTLFGLLAVEIAVANPAVALPDRRGAVRWSRCSSSTARSTACASARTRRSSPPSRIPSRARGGPAPAGVVLPAALVGASFPSRPGALVSLCRPVILRGPRVPTVWTTPENRHAHPDAAPRRLPRRVRPGPAARRRPRRRGRRRAAQGRTARAAPACRSRSTCSRTA